MSTTKRNPSSSKVSTIFRGFSSCPNTTPIQICIQVTEYTMTVKIVSKCLQNITYKLEKGSFLPSKHAWISWGTTKVSAWYCCRSFFLVYIRVVISHHREDRMNRIGRSNSSRRLLRIKEKGAFINMPPIVPTFGDRIYLFIMIL